MIHHLPVQSELKFGSKVDRLLWLENGAIHPNRKEGLSNSPMIPPILVFLLLPFWLLVFIFSEGLSALTGYPGRRLINSFAMQTTTLISRNTGFTLNTIQMEL